MEVADESEDDGTFRTGFDSDSDYSSTEEEDYSDDSEYDDDAWQDADENFVPRFDTSVNVPHAEITVDLDGHSLELDIFLKLFPKSLIQQIAYCTNERIEMLKKNHARTDYY